MAASDPPNGEKSPERREYEVPMGRSTVPPALSDPNRRLEWGIPADPGALGDYMIELNLLHRRGIEGAWNRFKDVHREAVGILEKEGKLAGPEPVRVAKTYLSAQMTVHQWRLLVQLDEQAEQPGDRAIYRLWPDFPVQALMDRSVATVKGDAAQRSFAAAGGGIVWAVIDSGVDGDHPHFGLTESEAEKLGVKRRHTLCDPEVADLHRDFSLADPDADPNLSEHDRQDLLERHQKQALIDECGHGTHVAGIIAGGLTERAEDILDCCFFERRFESNQEGQKIAESVAPRPGSAAQFRGVAPDALIVSLKVLDAKGRGKTSDIIRALDYIRDKVNGNPKLLRIHGVNLSVGYEFDAEMFACGQSPICVEVDRLVQAGVAVVTASGNTGYSVLTAIAAGNRATRVGLSNTINDPGNAALAITVGATHRDSPHTFGVSYFSSKGPTGDGRLKPDLVAPGERITSCAAGKKLIDIREKLRGPAIPALSPIAAPTAAATPPPPGSPPRLAAYIDDSGTSMAAPHVSGAIAAFLSIRREFIGKPSDVKKIFLDSATSLGRERYFEGNGLVDLMRAIQSV